MPPDLHRRTVIAASAATLGAAVAGCTGGTDEGGTPDPDEGPDSYGIHVFNEASSTHQVRTRVTQPWEDEVVFEERVDIEPGESRTWHQVITEETDHAIVAEIDRGETDRETSTAWATPGSDGSPPDAHLQVKVDTTRSPGGSETPFVIVYFESAADEYE